VTTLNRLIEGAGDGTAKCNSEVAFPALELFLTFPILEALVALVALVALRLVTFSR